MAQPAEQLVGRAAELGVLDRALAELERRRPGALELVGEPGIGKTRRLAELGARGHVVLDGSASELERELPFWVFVASLDDYVQGLEQRRLAALDDAARADLGHVLPSQPAPPTGASQDGRHRAHRAMRRLLEAIGTPKPLVLLLDDPHWADSGSIELLGALLRRLPSAPVLIAVAVRPRQQPDRLSAALERARRAGALTRVELGALSPEEAGRLVGEAPAAALYEESRGNPFYLEQLARAPAGEAHGATVAPVAVDVPPAVAAALAEELALPEPGTRRVLESAAVAGDPFDPEVAAAAAAVAEAEAVGILDDLLARDLVRPADVPRRFRFRHPLVRRAVYEATPGGWRLGAHEQRVSELGRAFATALLVGDEVAAEVAIREAMDAGLATAEIDDEIIAPALWLVGELWERGEISIADEHLATEISIRVLTLQREAERLAVLRGRHRVMLAAPEGEQHVVALRMIANLLRDAGYEVLMLGGDVPPRALATAAGRHAPDVVCLSSTMPGGGDKLLISIYEVQLQRPAAAFVVGGRGLTSRVRGQPGVSVCGRVSEVVEAVDAVVKRADQN